MKNLLKHSQPHDWFFRGTFIGEVPSEFLESYESPDQLSLLNLKALTIESNHFSNLQDNLVTDLIVSVPFKSNPKQVVSYCIEHQSKADPLMPIRMMRYKGALLSRSANEDSSQVPLVKSLVLYTGEHRYPDKTTLSSLTNPPEGWVLGDNESVFDLIWSREAEQKAKGKYYPFVLKAFNARYDKDLIRVKELFEGMSEMKSPGEKRFVTLVKTYVYEVQCKDKREALLELESSIKSKKGGKPMQSAGECLRRLGRLQSIREYKGAWEERGKQEGIQKGKHEGMQKGIQQMAVLMRKNGLPENLINEMTAQSLCEVV